MSPRHCGPPWGHLTSFQVGLRSSGTTRVLLGTPAGGDRRDGGGMSGWGHGGTGGWLALSPCVEMASAVPRCGWHHPVTRGCHPGAPGWPMPSCDTAMDDAIPSQRDGHRGVPPSVPSSTSEAGRHVHAGPGAGGPGDVGAGHQQPQHGCVPMPLCHQDAVTPEPGCVPEWHHGGRGGGTGTGQGHCCWLGLVGVTVCPCHRVLMSLCPHVPVSPYL